MTYREPITRCQAITHKKTRCTRDATACHEGKSYCTSHHEIIVELKLQGRKLGIQVMKLEGKIV